MYFAFVVSFNGFVGLRPHAKEEDMNEFVDRLRRDQEATRTALAMAEAIHRHLQDLHDDDPGDHDQRVLPLLDEAERHADVLARVVRKLTEGRQS